MELSPWSWLGLTVLGMIAIALIRSMFVDYRDVKRLRKRVDSRGGDINHPVFWAYFYHSSGRIIFLVLGLLAIFLFK